MELKRLLIATCLTVVLAACGGSAAPTPSTAEPAAAPAGSPTVARAAASPLPSPSPSAPAPTATSATAPAARATTVYVGNTDGQGVFIRKTPVMADRLRAYPDGTALTITGDDVDGDGQHWHHVTTPDGVEGYVPTMYTVESPP